MTVFDCQVQPTMAHQILPSLSVVLEALGTIPSCNNNNNSNKNDVPIQQNQQSDVIEMELSEGTQEELLSGQPSEMDYDSSDESLENTAEGTYFCHSKGNSDYDASIFVRAPIAATELDAVAGKVKSALEQPLRTIERDGYGFYQQHIEELKVNAERKKKKDDERTQQALSDSVIRGNPREYQTKLFEIAKKKNIIVNLGTGCGKTLIAVLLIKYFAPSLEDGKQILFMVPSVALAVQQTSTLRANLDFSVETACCNSNCSERSRRKLASCNIIVATHGAIHDLLMHYGDLFRMDQFSLLVVDECHYAYGRHPYCLVMNDFYHKLEPESRPRVLGLTASPLVNVKASQSDNHLNEMLGRLESTLDAVVTSVFALCLEDKEQFNLMLKCADERDILYASLGPTYELPPFENIGLHHGRIREFNQLVVLNEELGPKVLSIYCRTLAREVSCNAFEKETPEQFTRAVQHLHTIANFADVQCTSCPRDGRSDKLLALEELLEEQIECATGSNMVGLVFVERRITALALSDYFRHRSERVAAGLWIRAQEIRSPRTSSLRKRPRENSLDETWEHCGQFDDAVESEETHDEPTELLESERMHVDTLTGYGHTDDDENSDEQFMDADEPMYAFLPSKAPSIPHSEATTRNFDVAGSDFDRVTCIVETIRCGVLVRNSTNIFKSLNPTQKTNKIDQAATRKTWLHQETKIRDTLNKLRRKEINVLIATSVVEEGVDVQACSFVAVFDTIKSTKAYIQMKGRARQEDAKFFVFQAENNAGKGNISLVVAQEMEQRVHRFLATRVPVLHQPVEETNDYFGQSTSLEIQALESKSFVTKNGRVDLNTAKSLVNRYALSVPMDPFARSSKDIFQAHLPVYEGYQLFLPSHLPREMRVVTLPERYRNDTSKKDRESLCALMACARLYSMELLNDRLLPLTKEDMRNRILQVANQEPPEIPVHRPQRSDMPTAFVYIIQQSSPSFDACGTVLKGNGRRLALITAHPLSIQIPTIVLRHRQFGKVNVELGEKCRVSLSDQEQKVLSDFFLLLFNTRWRRKSQAFYFRGRRDGETGVIVPYFVGLVTANGVLDWDNMTKVIKESKRTMEERIDAVRLRSGCEPLPSPRLWSPIFDRNVTYVAYGPSGGTCDQRFPFAKEDIETYKDYFQKVRNFDVEGTSPLYDAQRCWHLPVKLTKLQESSTAGGSAPKKKNYTASFGSDVLTPVQLPRDACFEPPLADAFIFLSCTFLPQVLYIVERHIAAKAFVQHCATSLPLLGSYLENLPPGLVHEALSAKSCCLDVSFEKLEWLGDAVLKLVQTHSLLNSIDLNRWIPFLHEGDLSSLRSAMGSNDHLEKTCKLLHFDEFVLTVPLARGQWIPSQLELYTPGDIRDEGITAKNPNAGKVYADVMESLLGLIFLNYGYRTALEVAGELRLTLPWHEDNENPKQYNIEPKPRLLLAAARCTGHTNFSRPELVEEAFTHSSALHPEVASYQRLEWAGDAVLCLTVRERIYKQFPDIALGEMVVMEAALVANETLAYISVKNGLPKLINHRDQSLPARIETYDWSVKELGRGLWGTDPPKVISDVVESLIGAVYVDAGFTSGQSAVNRLLEPIFQYLSRPRSSMDDIPLKHPKKVMQEIGGSLLAIVSYTESELAALKKEKNENTLIWHGNGWRKLDPKGQSYVAGIQFVGNDLVLVADSSPVVARSRACAFVVCMLEKDPDLLQRLRTVNSLVERSNMMQLNSGKHDDDEDVDDDEKLPL